LADVSIFKRASSGSSPRHSLTGEALRYRLETWKLLLLMMMNHLTDPAQGLNRRITDRPSGIFGLISPKPLIQQWRAMSVRDRLFFISPAGQISKFSEANVWRVSTSPVSVVVIIRLLFWFTAPSGRFETKVVVEFFHDPLPPM
jgi:hypothetical protein